MKEYYGTLSVDFQNNPKELQPTPEYLEMTRDEQMKWHW